MNERNGRRLHVIGIQYWGVRPVSPQSCPVPRYEASGIFEAAGLPINVIIPAPQMHDDRCRSEDISEPERIGKFGGVIAGHVAAAAACDDRVLMVGGNCAHITGVLGGLQDAHGPDARIGLIWLDAHGDFNTPMTSPSGMLGGMPVAVAAGLTHGVWREASHIRAPIPTDRIVMIDVRNLDEAESMLVRSSSIMVVDVPREEDPLDERSTPLCRAVQDLAGRCDMLYLHVDSDILDAEFVPNHPTREPDGPSLAAVQRVIRWIMATNRVVAFAVVSVNAAGPEGLISLTSAIELMRAGLEGWRDL